MFEVVNLIEIILEFLIYEVVDEFDISVMYKFDIEGVKFEIICESDGMFVIFGYDIEKIFKMIDFLCDEFVCRFVC